ncbi:MAG: FAD-dependent oxidoreductase [Rhizobiaceae bacterium]
MPRTAYPAFGYVPPPELAGGPPPDRYSVAIVGAGPTGLALAIDLALHGIASVVLDDNDVVSTGSRAICWSKRTLEIFDRLGVGERVASRGVTWKVGRLFHRDRELWNFDLLPEAGHKMPAFVNLQQYHVEAYLVERARDFPELIDLRFRNRVGAVRVEDGGVVVHVETPDGRYRLTADWLVACDGANSAVRGSLGLEFAGRFFEERFLIADIEMKADFPPERWFWFEPPFHGGGSALLHKQPVDIWRIDLQLGPDADPLAERRPENVVPRLQRMLGRSDFELDWVSVYTFQCRRLERFVHDRVIFAGDAAHVVSPFGARGGNGAIQDVDNLGWKLALVVGGVASSRLLASYDEERTLAADENILASSRATAFMTPKSAAERIMRDAVLDLAADMPFARRLVNSGRLSTPCSLAGLSLQTSSIDSPAAPGLPCPDAPIRVDGRDGWLLDRLGGRFALLHVGDARPPVGLDLPVVRVSPPALGPVEDVDGLVASRYGEGWSYLVRPDQHVAAAFREPFGGAVQAALNRAMAKN